MEKESREKVNAGPERRGGNAAGPFLIPGILGNAGMLNLIQRQKGLQVGDAVKVEKVIPGWPEPIRYDGEITEISDDGNTYKVRITTEGRSFNKVIPVSEKRVTLAGDQAASSSAVPSAKVPTALPPPPLAEKKAVKALPPFLIKEPVVLPDMELLPDLKRSLEILLNVANQGLLNRRDRKASQISASETETVPDENSVYYHLMKKDRDESGDSKEMFTEEAIGDLVDSEASGIAQIAMESKSPLPEPVDSEASGIAQTAMEEVSPLPKSVRLSRSFVVVLDIASFWRDMGMDGEMDDEELRANFRIANERWVPRSIESRYIKTIFLPEELYRAAMATGILPEHIEARPLEGVSDAIELKRYRELIKGHLMQYFMQRGGEFDRFAGVHTVRGY